MPRDGSAPDISVSHRDGVACCTTQSPELKLISGGKDVFMISSSLECAGQKVGVTLHEKKRIRRDNDFEERKIYVCTCM